MSECKSCCGDGVERCDNPDHGFIGAMSFHDIGRIGCPCCGHNPDYKMKSWKDGKWEWNKCPECNGNGLEIEINKGFLGEISMGGKE